MMNKVRHLILIICLSFSYIHAQDLYQSRQHGHYSYIFELDGKQMKSLILNRYGLIDTTWLTKPVDSFLTGSSYDRVLPAGSYLMATLEAHRVAYQVLQVPPFHPVVMEYHTDLVVQLTDNGGRVIRDAVVNVGRKSVPYDTVLQGYRLPATFTKGLLEVRHGEHLSSYRVHARHRFPFLSHRMRRLKYSAPVQYIWTPVRIAGTLPFHLIRSFSRGYPVGWVGRIQHGFQRCLCIVNERSCKHVKHAFAAKHNGYLVFSQPMYRPGDTVSYKASIHKRNNGKPAGRRAVVLLYGNNKTLTLDTINSYRKGAFSGSFVLADSMPLRIDTDYQLRLVTERGAKPYISGSFKYADYVLNGIDLEWNTVSADHYRGREYVMELSGYDDNRMHLFDARFEIAIRRDRVSDFLGSNVFLNDTLASFTRKALPDKPTRVVISDTLFPAANFDYTVEVTLVTTDNRREQKTRTVSFYHQRATPIVSLDLDSVRFTFEENGLRRDAKGRIYIVTSHPYRQLLYEGALPYTVPLNPYAVLYELEAGGQQAQLPITPQVDPMVSGHISDEGEIPVLTIENPRSLPLTWFVYRRGKVIAEGQSDEAVIQRSFKKQKDLLVKVFYLFGGRYGSILVANCPNRFELLVDMAAPDRVFPGQQAEIGITVTDHTGKPIHGADITAYGITAGFKHTPLMPLYAASDCALNIPFNQIQLTGIHQQRRYGKMHLPFWSQYGRPDTIAWYKYAYPKGGVQMGSSPNPDQITQVSPWLVRNGQFVTPRALYIDGKPVWLGWTNNEHPYAFPVSEGLHRFRFLTTTHVYLFDTLITGNGEHTFLSLDIANPPPGLWSREVGKKSIDTELKRLEQFTMVYNPAHRYGDELPFVRQRDRLFSMGTRRWPPNPIIIGPVDPGLAEFVLYDQSSLRFKYEPYYEYTAKPGLLIMRSQHHDYYHHLTRHHSTTPFGHISRPALTEEQVSNEYRQREIARVRQMRWVSFHSVVRNKSGTLVVKQPLWSHGEMPLLVFLLHHESGRWTGMGGVEQSHERWFRDLRPGNYTVVWVFDDRTCQRYDSLVVREHCISYYAPSSAVRRPVNELSRGAANLLDTLLTKGSQPITTMQCILGWVPQDSTRQIQLSDYFDIPDEADLNGEQTLSSMVVAQALSYMPSMRASLKSVEVSRFVRMKRKSLNEASTTDRLPDASQVFNPHRGKVVDPNHATVVLTSSIRNNFADKAFWEPSLRTDRMGRASFSVTFPDDITAWSTFVLVTGDRKQRGYHHRVIPSYKTLQGQLQAPRFLVAGDTSRVVATVSNYLGDTVTLTRRFQVDDHRLPDQEGAMTHGLTDTFRVTTGLHDTLWMTYTIHRSDGYFDGERRGVPVMPIGTENVAAQWHIIHKEMQVTLLNDTVPEEVHVRLMADMPTLIDNELQYLIDFKYDCNEQLASRLLALLFREKLGLHPLRSIVLRKQINNIIGKLTNNRNDSGLWGWWKGGLTTWWITEHVVYALTKAKEAGYRVPVTNADLLLSVHHQYHLLTSTDDKIMALRTLLLVNPGVRVNAFMEFRETHPALNHQQQLKVWELEQLAGLEVSADSVMQLHRHTFTGEIWFGGDTASRQLVNDELLSTITALKVLLKTDAITDSVAGRVVNWLLKYPFENRLTTYTRARWLDALMLCQPLLNQWSEPPLVEITGTLNQRVDRFPYEFSLAATEQINIINKSSQRVFVSAVQRQWNTNPALAANGIRVNSRFGHNDTLLAAGKEITLYVDVVADRTASYVMIEIPIPAGCVYGARQETHRLETWREQYKDGATLFCEKLPKGKHTFSVTLLPRFTGSYAMNPARAEMMYKPDINGNTGLKRVIIEYFE